MASMTNIAQLAVVLDRNKIGIIPSARVAFDAARLHQLAKAITRRAARACNQPMTPSQQSLAAKCDAVDYRLAEIIAGDYGAKVKRMENARGFAIRLILPNGDNNSMGGAQDGWGVPS